ncbi:cupin domain-containing protein [Mycolicibacterium smegmatis]|uniref:Cupin domain protein n=1 Tax=Mycolicibacterium smegmatis (strain MKD8) TaxID=1214915 RepID=A0A2U9PRU6_MYCSE|nr:cupin domain-containing protein [Mycolicibacterium smegmatis]AWT54458.1 cupin domain protein [Mycolicibacterium smegmatis MKD8]
MPHPSDTGIIANLAAGAGFPALDAAGPTVEFVTFSDDEHNQICVLRAVLPPGVTVPLHSHNDFEDFYILSGQHQVLIDGDDGLQWHDVRAGDYVRVPGDALHAHRNISDEPAVDLVITTPQIGRFFREIGRPAGPPPMTPAELAHFVATAQRYGYRLGTPEENAAVGITLPGFTS